MFRKIAATTVSLLLASIMLTSCTSTNNNNQSKNSNRSSSTVNDKNSDNMDIAESESSAIENNSSENELEKSKNAKDELNNEIIKLEGFIDQNEGSASMDIVYDSAESDKKATWNDLLQLTNSQSKDIDFDLSASINAQWSDNSALFDISILDEDIVSFGCDEEYYYFDLSHIESVCKKAGIWDNNFEETNDNGIAMADLLQIIKIPKSELDDYLQEQDNMFNVEKNKISNIKETLKSIFSNDKLIESMKSISEKAKIDGEDIIINNITSEDMQDLKAIFSSIDPKLTDINTPSSLSADTENTINYRLKYDNEEIDQVHQISKTDLQNNVTSIYVSVSEKADVNLEQFYNAKSFKDIMGIEFKDFISLVQANAQSRTNSSNNDSAPSTM